MEEQETTAEVLLRRGKRGAAVYLQAHSHPAQLLNELLNFILDPNKPVDMWDTQDWCNWLMAGGKNPTDFASTVRRYTSATMCGLVWTSNFVAYRCRTCGISPCMSLCAQCFRLGNHEGHDFNMFRSQAGGACDCGDTNVMKDSGFCTRHGRLNADGDAADRIPPPDLLTMAQLMMPRVILRLVQHLRETSARQPAEQQLALSRADSFIDYVDKLAAMGDPMRVVITQSLTNPSMYHQLTKERDENYENAKQRLKNWECPIDNDVRALRPELVHETFLEELVFWMVRYECPQKLTCLLLSMLPEQDYKVQFTRTFVMHYTRMSLMLTQCRDSDTLSNRVVQVSVQLFSNEALSVQMVHEEQLLHVMVISMKAMMKKTLQQSTLQDAEKNLHYVIDCGHDIAKQHCYWPLVSDLNNILTHKRVVMEFLSDARLLDVWFSLLSMYQGMNVHHRETERHIEFEPSTYYAAFSAELEASATPMWAFLIHLTDHETLNLSILVLKQCVMALEDFYDSINFRATDKPTIDQVSFHLPLHRYLACFIRNCVLFQNAGSVERVFEIADITNTSFLKCLIAHPLQTIISFYEIIAANMWVRNGLHMKGQAMTYIQSHFCNSMVDPDIFLLQVCGSQLDNNWFISTVIERFRVGPILTLRNMSVDDESELDEKFDAMLNSLLTFLATLTSVRTMMNANEEECTREEMVSLLCMSDRTHSQIIDLLPEKCGQYGPSVPHCDRHMSAVADYKAPNFEVGGHMIQGTYTPKASVWENSFDPIHLLLRSVHRKDYQAALNRFAAHTGIKNCWPPYRIPPGVHEGLQDPRKLLFSSSLQALAFVILHKAVRCRNEEIDEQILSLSVYLLELAVEFHSKDTCRVCRDRQGPLVAADENLVINEVGDGVEHFKSWYPSSCPIISSLTLIKNVEIVETNEDATESASTALKVTSMDLDLESLDEQTSAITHVQQEDSESKLGLFVDLRAETSAGTSATDNSQYALLLRHSVELMASHSGRSVSIAMETDEGDGDLIDFSEDATMASLPAPMPLRYLVRVNESVISLLLKLYAKLASSTVRSGNKTSSQRCIYRTPQEEGQVSVPSSRIGDGVHFVGILLDRYCLSHSSVEARIRQIRDSIWPSEVQEGVQAPTKTDAQLKEERRKKARERQQKLMQEFANRQKSFLKQCNEVMDDEMPESKEEEKEACLKEYECVICSQTSPTTAERPVAIVVLLQATSVLGHARPPGEAPLNLPCSDLETLPASTSRASYSKRRFDELTRHFDSSSWYRSANIGWEGGVHVQTCGHYLHVDCHKSYMLSQRSQHHQDFHRMNQTLAPDRGEYLCPLCRQLANSVLPIHPSMGEHQAVVQCNPRTHRNVATEMSELMAGLPMPSTSILKEMSAFMEDLTNATYVQYRTMVYLRTAHPTYPLSLFVCSLARTNLEIDLLLHDGQLPPNSDQQAAGGSSNGTTSTSRKSCFVPLFHVLALHLKVSLQHEQEKEALAESPLFHVWHSLTGLPVEPTTSLAPVEKHVPFLIRDISSMLIEFLLSLPINLDKVYFTCVVRVLYSLAVTQSVCRTLCRLTRQERHELREKLDRDPTTGFNPYVSVILAAVKKMGFLNCEESEEPGLCGQQFESYIERSVIPFLRICALLQMHLFNEPLPKREDTEFRALSSYLGLGEEQTGSSQPAAPLNALSIVQWVTDGVPLVDQWCKELACFVEADRAAARSLLVDQPLSWQQPYLLGLPKNYSTLFEYYHRKVCNVCQSAPTDPSLCLACGTLVCLRELCCRRQDTPNFEAVQHSIDCGAGTAVFLVVNSTSIIVVRGKRACLWGSVYLDSFGEEDRDLKRGKPLYLSEDRYALLQHQWVTHSFDHCTHKRWAWHKDSL